MDYMLTNARKICASAGTSLANVVRIQQFHTDLNEFYPAYQVWQQHLPGQHLPYSAVEVPFIPVPGCSVLLDLWVYAP
jgi:enamine deaminase RidA (YjgF/YER057c/UK114 family)